MPPMEPLSQSESREAAPPRRLIFLLESAWYAFGLAVVLALGVVNLLFPFGLDQAMYFFGAGELDRGATLYVDYWDNKQPGLYVFYLVAGRLFGFSEFGIHLFELIWMLAFAVLLMATLRPHLQAPWRSALVPAASIGVYYATVGEHELTQLEMLVGLPLYVCAWCALHAVGQAVTPARMALLFFLAGLAAGLATLFKLLLAPIPVALWLVASVYLLKDRKTTLLGLLPRLWLPAAAGVALPIAAVVFWFWQAGALRELLWTAFVYPPEALASSPPASPTRLVTAAGFFFKNTAPWLLFAGLACALWLRRLKRGESSPLIVLMLVWLAMAAMLFLAQRFSWWYHHTLLLLTPFGILAVCGLDGLTAYVNRFIEIRARRLPAWLAHRTASAMICATVIALPPVASLTNPLVTKALPLFAGARLLDNGVQFYQWEVSENYRRLWRGSRFLTMPTAEPGPIYIFGNSIVYSFTGRRSAHTTTGSAWRFYLPSQTREILATLDRRQTPYVFVDRNDIKLYSLRPEVAAYLEQRYEIIKRDDSGIWYERLPEDQDPHDAPTP